MQSLCSAATESTYKDNSPRHVASSFAASRGSSGGKQGLAKAYAAASDVQQVPSMLSTWVLHIVQNKLKDLDHLILGTELARYVTLGLAGPWTLHPLENELRDLHGLILGGKLARSTVAAAGGRPIRAGRSAGSGSAVAAGCTTATGAPGCRSTIGAAGAPAGAIVGTAARTAPRATILTAARSASINGTASASTAPHSGT